MDIIEELKYLPTTRYQGSKRKILTWIYECVKDLEFNTVLDAFGGSGVVSYLFKKMEKSVTYNDILKFNQIIGDSIITNSQTILTNDDVKFIITNSNVHKSVITSNFSGIYFLDDENIWLDKIICNIENLNKFYCDSELNFKKSIAYNALFQSCMIKRPYNLFHRKNLEMRTRNVKRNFGNKTTWETSFENHFKKFVSEINKSVFDTNIPCRSINNDVFNIENIDFDLVYLDSPYIKSKVFNESSDYLRCYHFLEGIARYNRWEQMIDYNSLNKHIKKDSFTNKFVHKDAIASFYKLIEKFQNSIIVISYKYGGDPSIDELVEILHIFKENIRIHDRHYKYALNKQNGNAILNREYILIGY